MHADDGLSLSSDEGDVKLPPRSQSGALAVANTRRSLRQCNSRPSPADAHNGTTRAPRVRFTVNDVGLATDWLETLVQIIYKRMLLTGNEHASVERDD